MKKRVFILGNIFLAGIWTATMLGMGAEEEIMAVFPMSEKEETCIQVQSGQKFSLKLIANPGTGYGWELAAPLDDKMLTLVETKNEEPDSGLLGACEVELWICRALTAGHSEISLKYVRPWEKDVAPLKKHLFKVQIQ